MARSEFFTISEGLFSKVKDSKRWSTRAVKVQVEMKKLLYERIDMQKADIERTNEQHKEALKVVDQLIEDNEKLKQSNTTLKNMEGNFATSLNGGHFLFYN
ncbi:conserved hypothetical protein [Ricinus communis]|uniref:Uncharacterized protein n=1 Tax=Ricinus communis TaxID=3988 RepID=B9SS34_RICCO|nr:conserved hypothetical protein [Ricinus communis]